MTLSQEHKHPKSLCGVRDGFQRARLGHKGPVVLRRAKRRKRRPRGNKAEAPECRERPAQVRRSWSVCARGTCRRENRCSIAACKSPHTSAEAKSLGQFTELSIRGQPLSTVCQPVGCSPNGTTRNYHCLGHSHPCSLSPAGGGLGHTLASHTMLHAPQGPPPPTLSDCRRSNTQPSPQLECALPAT